MESNVGREVVTGLARVLGWLAAVAGAVMALLGGIGIFVPGGPGIAVFAVGLVLLVIGWVFVRDPSPREVLVVEPDPTELDQLEQLGRLRDQGVLTAAEFEARKAQLLEGR